MKVVKFSVLLLLGVGLAVSGPALARTKYTGGVHGAGSGGGDGSAASGGGASVSSGGGDSGGAVGGGGTAAGH